MAAPGSCDVSKTSRVPRPSTRTLANASSLYNEPVLSKSKTAFCSLFFEMLAAASFILAALLLTPHLVTYLLPVASPSATALLAPNAPEPVATDVSAALSSLPLVAPSNPSLGGHHRSRLIPSPLKFCSPLTLKAVRSLPGMAAYAASENFAPAKIYRVDDFACIRATVDITAGPVNCTVVELHTQGRSVEAPDEIVFPYVSGFETVVQMKTTSASSLMARDPVDIRFQVPMVGDETEEAMSDMLVIKNKKGSKITTTVSELVEREIKVDAPANSYCYLKHSFSECTSPGATAHVAIIAGTSYYDTEVCARKFNGDKFCFTLDEALDEAGRTSYMILEGSLSSESNIKFEGKCEPISNH
ncbi:hypothetical protein DFH06DRAFT_1480536 [Mycena polygramma]|nr:hypothetical protein DFH06DRAFT_1480536 [Mycena polygramma]